jgi:mitotic-spindle organizing protein 1
LNCGLDEKTLAISVALIENGVNPEALATVVKELKRETAALRVNIFITYNIIVRRRNSWR